ncbi:hypothetical protein [Microbacterium sp. OR16]|uniref:hypothetical protein n=1 Tax=Microbacterium sp. OR16 TaxID=3095345 RepID=UPI0039B3B2B5
MLRREPAMPTAGFTGHAGFMLDVSRHPASGIRHPASGIRHPASGIRHPASDLPPTRCESGVDTPDVGRIREKRPSSGVSAPET